jgi:hypothetical protein
MILRSVSKDTSRRHPTASHGSSRSRRSAPGRKHELDRRRIAASRVPPPPDLRLLCDLKGVINLSAELPHRGLELRVPEQQLHGAQVLRAPIDQRRLGPAHRVRSVFSAVQPQFIEPVPEDPGVLPNNSRRRRVNPSPRVEATFDMPVASATHDQVLISRTARSRFARKIKR